MRSMTPFPISLLHCRGRGLFVLALSIGRRSFSAALQIPPGLLGDTRSYGRHDNRYRQPGTKQFSASVSTKLSSSGDDVTIGYISDVEGDFDYWSRCVEHSSVLLREENSQLMLRNERCYFVYGGDTVDRGPGDLRVVRELVQLKERYPDRVTLIMGNRDVNKLRILPALQEDILWLPPRSYWLRTRQQQKVDFSNYRLGDTESKMKWMLGRTMGAHYAYEFRRHEMQLLGREDSTCGNSTGPSPVASYMNMMQPGTGLMARYLQLAQISVVIGDVLFVHGAVRPHNIGWVPPRWNSTAHCIDSELVDGYGGSSTSLIKESSIGIGYEVSDPVVWSSHINRFAAGELQDYNTRIHQYLESMKATAVKSGRQGEERNAELYAMVWDTSGGYDHSQPGSRLIQYGMGRWADGTVNPSVIYASYLQNGLPILPNSYAAAAHQRQNECLHEDYTSVTQWLQKGGIRTVIVGHQPNGDAPFILKDEELGVKIISADTAYSRNVQWNAAELLTHCNRKMSDTVDNSVLENSRGIDEDGDQWITYEDFLNLQQKEDLVQQKAPGARLETTADWSTRSNSSISEVSVLQSSSAEDTASRITIKGQLSNGATYDFELNSRPVDSSSGVNDDYIGRMTRDGWFVKAGNVSFPNDSQASSYYLLAHSEGYTFRNRLVATEDIDDEFAAT